MQQLIEGLISALEYHVEQTRPIHSTTVALQAAKEALKQEQGEPVALNLSQFKLVAFQTDHPQDKKPMEWQEAFAQGWNGMIAALEKVGPIYTTPQQRKPLPKSEWPKHPSAYFDNEYVGYAKSDLDAYAAQVLAAHGIKE